MDAIVTPNRSEAITSILANFVCNLKLKGLGCTFRLVDRTSAESLCCRTSFFAKTSNPTNEVGGLLPN